MVTIWSHVTLCRPMPLQVGGLEESEPFAVRLRYVTEGDAS